MVLGFLILSFQARPEPKVGQVPILSKGEVLKQSRRLVRRLLC